MRILKASCPKGKKALKDDCKYCCDCPKGKEAVKEDCNTCWCKKEGIKACGPKCVEQIIYFFYVACLNVDEKTGDRAV